MGRDNQPKERQRRDLERKLQRGKVSCERVLIVSEGSKTEPQYFDEIRKEFRLPVRNITVSGSELGTAPIQVVEYAEQTFKKGNPHKGIEPRAFDRIFAVFDRDQHHSYFDALSQAEALDNKLRNDAKQKVPFKAIASVPCFELWLLLHYEDIRTPMHRDDVMRCLKQYIPDYTKGMNRIFAITRSQLDTAMKRVEMLASRGFNARTPPDPFTDVAELVNVLRSRYGTEG